MRAMKKYLLAIAILISIGLYSDSQETGARVGPEFRMNR
jgi:hypothetical protein